MKILFFLSGLHAGGAQRVVVTLASELAYRGHTLLIVCKCRKPRLYHPEESVRIVELDLCRASGNPLFGLMRNVGRVQRLSSLLVSEQPDILVSFLTYNNILAIIAGRRRGIPTVVSERTAAGFLKSRLWRTLRTLFYPKATALVTQTAADAKYYQRFMETEVIANPLGIACTTPVDFESRPTLSVVAVGRLQREKGFDLLLRAIALSRSDFFLTIAGSGSELPALQELAAGLGIAERVRFVGQVMEVERLYNSHRYFAMASRYEGYPNALLEAMSCGCACVSTACDHGPRELIEHGETGLLVPIDDEFAMSAALDMLAQDEEMSLRLSQQARKVSSSHGINAITDQWEALFERVCAE